MTSALPVPIRMRLWGRGGRETTLVTFLIVFTESFVQTTHGRKQSYFAQWFQTIQSIVVRGLASRKFTAQHVGQEADKGDCWCFLLPRFILSSSASIVLPISMVGLPLLS